MGVERYVEFGAGQAPLACRLRRAASPHAAQIIMLHGLTGDEQSMWALEAATPPDAMLVTPRGPFPQPQGGYAWNRAIQAWPPLLAEFETAADKLEVLLAWLADRFDLDRQRVVLMGFSNGAAMAFAAPMLGMTIAPAGVVAMSGHLPQGRLEPLAESPIFWSHGTQDPFIPIDVARADVARLRAIGAMVDYCEAEVGHKLGAGCRDELRDWYRAHTHFTSERMP